MAAWVNPFSIALERIWVSDVEIHGIVGTRIRSEADHRIWAPGKKKCVETENVVELLGSCERDAYESWSG